MNEPRRLTAHCSECGGDRNHLKFGTVKTSWHSDEAGMSGGTEYSLIQCSGCDHVAMRIADTCTEERDYETGELIPTYKYMPPAALRKLPHWLRDFEQEHPTDKSIGTLLRQVYWAIHAEAFNLAAMGIRALLEHVMIDQVSDKGSFKGNLTAFAAAGHVTETQRDFLDSALEAGHASMHRGYTPPRPDLMNLLDISEGIIQSIYVVAPNTAAMRAAIPPRK
ncbi:DUF4145 domain-containing protein [Alienimonas californiensis]|uniref:DUF4145 domain-containing protein n=1 Tax=Alienimonas californiensis TaxID=2527989 RepID=UPI0011A4107D|nr:DUF4145 domain-containing protein [Alienimonas californiensis]